MTVPREGWEPAGQEIKHEHESKRGRKQPLQSAGALERSFRLWPAGVSGGAAAVEVSMAAPR